MLPSSSTKNETGLKWLRMLEITVGIIVLVLGVVLWWPHTDWGEAFPASLALALIILETVYIIRTYAKGVATRRHPSLMLSVLAILIAFWALGTTFFFRRPELTFFEYAILVLMLATGLLFAGIASATRGTASGKIAGVLVILISLAVFISPKIEGILTILAMPITLLFPDFTYQVFPQALVTLSLMITALETLISGITGRSI